jgi:hypothetical protein
VYTVQIILLQYSTHKLCEEDKVTDGEKFPKYCQPWELQAQSGQRWQCHVVFTECYQNQYNTFMSSENLDYFWTSSHLIKERIILYFFGKYFVFILRVFNLLWRRRFAVSFCLSYCSEVAGLPFPREGKGGRKGMGEESVCLPRKETQMRVSGSRLGPRSGSGPLNTRLRSGWSFSAGWCQHAPVSRFLVVHVCGENL